MVDVREILESLPRDLAQWADAANAPPLDKHASQVTAVVSQLTSALDELRLRLQQTPSTTKLVQAVLDYHHVWDFFRSKLALRFIPWYQPFIAAADDLAWAAWHPVRDAVRASTGREIR